MSLDLTATAVAVTGVAAVRWWHNRRRQNSQRRALAATNDDPSIDALSTRHLSPKLANLAQQTRVVRLMLETPLRRYRPAVFSDTPWSRRKRCDEYDLALGDARRALWEWMHQFKHLEREDLHRLIEMGLSLAPFRSVLFKRGVFERCDDPWEQVLYPRAPDMDHVFRELHRTMYELKRFEFALTGHALDPYRG
ncbi:MAG: hypothetical protein R3A51_03125 [Nannocystaceae bacterium]|nr:hypothetical protein [Myxococcales bacterium]